MADSIKTLIARLKSSDDASLKRETLIELGYSDSERVYPVLIEQLDDPNSSVQHAAIISLRRYGDPRAIEQLVKPKNLHSPVVNIRWASVSALGTLGDYHIIEHLLKAVDDPEWIVRNQAVTELKEKIREIIACRDHKYARVLVRLFSLEHEEIINLVIEGFIDLGSKSIDVLLESLRSPSASVRKNAARALGYIHDNRSTIPLIELLKDEELSVRRAAAEALGMLQDKRAIEPLVQSLLDNVERVRQSAMDALAKFGKLASSPLLNAMSHERNKYTLRAIIRTLGSIGDVKAVPALIEKLSSSYFIVRRAAQHALIPFGPSISETLLTTLSYNKSNIRTLLIDARNDEHPELQLRAVKALGGLEEHRAVPILKTLVEQGQSDVQDAAANALIQIGCSAWGRCGALIVLSEIGDDATTPALIESLSDDSDNVRLEAIRAIARVDGPKAIDPLIMVARKDRDPYIRYEAVRYLRRIGVGYSEVLDLALAALQDSSRDVRSQAARLLGNFQDEKSIQPLLRAIADAHWSVRESAECALINFGSKAVPDLIGALNSPSWRTRFRVARLLGEIGDRRAIEPLEKLFIRKGERQKVRSVVQQALEKLKGKQAA